MPQALLRHKLYFANFLVGAYLAFAAYASSSFLATVIPEHYVGLVYIVAAVLSVLLGGLSYGPTLLSRFGTLRSFRLVTAAAIAVTVLLGLTKSPWLIVPLFIIYSALGLFLRLIIDIYLEATSPSGETGSIRGIFLTLHNLAWFLSPFLASLVISQTTNSFSNIYLISGLFLLPILYLAGRKITESPKAMAPEPLHLTIYRLICRAYVCNPNLWRVLIIDFILNFFYAIMVIYLALYLGERGFAWQQIGLIFTVMLAPFVIFEWPVGRLADKYFGEQELMLTGLFIMSGATLVIPFLTSSSIFIWAGVLFITRVGASIVEVTKESYLFKQLGRDDIDLLNLFRTTQPLAYIIGPLIGTIVLTIFNLPTLFILLAIICFTALYPASSLIDTR